MKRHQLFEIHDWPACPKEVRNGLTDFLQTAHDVRNTYEPIRARLLDAIARSGSDAVVDLCSGGGGPWVKWARNQLTGALRITLTDRFPNAAAIQELARHPAEVLRYSPEPVDATAVPPSLPGFRTIFTAFHHFTPALGKAILEDAVRHGQGIGVFEFTSRTVGSTLGMLLSPLGVWLFTPLMKNLRWPRLVLTYLLPVIPLVTTIDGVLSSLRSYTPDELKALANASDYEWSAGKQKGITYLIGVPKRARSSEGS